MSRADREATGFNPLCGDKLTVYLSLDNDIVKDISFEGTGCAISIASASMMTDTLRGCSATDANALISSVHEMFAEDEPNVPEQLDSFRALEGVRQYPSRIKCATLAWTALEAALHNKSEDVTTE
jgi:nitrogen fixation NifU-like protein